MKSIIAVVVEIRNEKVRQVSIETLHAAKQIAIDGDRIVAYLLGGNHEHVQSLTQSGADEIIMLEGEDLHEYSPDAYASALMSTIELTEPRVLLLGHTAIGRDLAPKIAAKLGSGIISDVISIHKSDHGEARYVRPIYAGKAFETKIFRSNDKLQIVTIRPNNIPSSTPDETRTAMLKTLTYSQPTLRTVVQEVVRRTAGAIDLSEAKVIVSGGRGVKSAEGFKPLQELADLLGGAVGASRGACDAGYCDYSLQIGQTGKVVTPELYIACGISGAIQHVAGMSQSRVIVAINKDPEAPIFKIADYGIVGDLFQVVPLLTEQLRSVVTAKA